MRARFVVAIAVLAACAGCGRRENRAWFDAKPAATASSRAAPATAAPLPPQATQVKWAAPDAPREMAADSFVTLPITFTNAGPAPWPDNATADPQKRDGSYAVRLVHRWLPAGAPLTPRVGGERTDLPRPVAPQETMTLPITVRAPSAPGDYQLVVEMIQELVQWFADTDARTLTIPIRVVPAGSVPQPSR